MLGSNWDVLPLMKQKRYALLTYSTNAEYLAAQNCDFSVLRDEDSVIQRSVAIALQKGSPYLDRFNEAVREMHADATVERLKNKYWGSVCEKPLYSCG